MHYGEPTDTDENSLANVGHRRQGDESPSGAPRAAKLPIVSDPGRAFWFSGQLLHQALKGNRNPGRGQRHLNKRPVLEQVTHASRMSGPPKQMFVVIGSGKGMNS